MHGGGPASKLAYLATKKTFRHLRRGGTGIPGKKYLHTYSYSWIAENTYQLYVIGSDDKMFIWIFCDNWLMELICVMIIYIYSPCL